MPLDNTYFWLRAITPTTALNHHHNKQQTQAYQVSWHRMFLLLLIRASLFLSPSLSLPYPDCLLAGDAEELLLEKLLERCQALGLLKARGTAAC
jgi:hypothetical protein